MKWIFSQPVEIVFESGGVKKLNELLYARGYRRGVLIADPYFVRSGLAAAVQGYCGDKLPAVFSDVTPNPLVGEVDACVARLRETGADFAVALGGGSAMDIAKAACAVLRGGGSVKEYHTGGKPLPKEKLPLIAIPTTAGTGSEVTPVSVLTDPAEGKKRPMGGPALYAAVALIDPELTLSVPPAVTASTGLDVLSHALEGFWSIHHQPVCDAVALHAARLVFDWLPVAFRDGGNLEAREKMAEASVLAGLAFALPKTAASHAISFPLTNQFGLPHGEACAFTLDALCAINAGAGDGRLNRFAEQLGFADAAAMGARITELKRQTGMRGTLGEAGIAADDLAAIIADSHAPNLYNNPVPLDDDALLALLSAKI